MGGCFSQAAAEVVEQINESLTSQQQQKPDDELSPIYSSLPDGAEKQPVRNVYDGDTLTLVDERRVRFLGIDTPEIKEQQPFAQEAKQYTKQKCHKQDVWLTFEEGREKEDHYGRLLAFVWVPSSEDNWLCVNEGIVAEGLATVYIPNSSSQFATMDKMISLQKQARANGKGMWSEFTDYDVVKTANGAAYHKPSCEHLASVKNLTKLKASDAMDMGLHPCRTCLADA